MHSIIPIILSGGAGTRLWPLSRELHPKQFLPLLNEDTLLQNTLKRISYLKTSPPIIICNEQHRFMVAEQLRQIDYESTAIILEPEGRNTAPAITLAALVAQQQHPDPILLILPADHFMENPNGFLQSLLAAKLLTQQGNIVTFGIKPNKPETGYGYIKTAEKIGGCGFKISQFIEKPDLATATQLLESEEYYWNSGIFMFHSTVYLNEIKKHAPGIIENCEAAIKLVTKDSDFIRPSASSFNKCENISIDYALMEKTDRGALIPLETEWSDLGSWDKLWEINQEKDVNNNVLKGDVIISNVKNSYISSSHRLIAAVGMEDCIIIETSDAILIINQNNCHEINNIIKHLKSNQRLELETHLKVFRPWGSYELLATEPHFQVKRLVINPKAGLSLQIHNHRSEHWVVVKGTAKVTRDDKIIILSENQSTYIPAGMKHRLENPETTPVEVIEIQSGSYFGEDDIIRFDDYYKR